jgi:hypothetical protein
MSTNVKFTAKFDGLNLATKSKITLILPENIKDEILAKLVRLKQSGVALIVHFGDPQASMDFDEDEDDRPYHRPGIAGRIDQQGVVQSVQSERDLFSDKNVSNPVENSTESIETGPVDPYENKILVFSQNENEDDSEAVFVEFIFPIVNGFASLPNKYVNGEFITILTFEEVIAEIGMVGIETDGVIIYKIDELIVFGADLRDINAVDTIENDLDSTKQLLDNESDLESDLDQTELDIQSDSEFNEEISFEEDPDQEQQPIVEPAAEEIELFILEKKPVFEDIPYDFPELLAQKKTGKTWMDIASSINEPSTKLSAAFSKYKKKVKDIMMGGAA